MFDISFAEIIVVMLVGVLIIGPKDIPHVVGGVVRFLRHVNKLISGIKKDVLASIDVEDIRQVKDEVEGIAGELGRVEGAKYIIDDAGNYQRVYDISDFIDEDRVRRSESRVAGREEEIGLEAAGDVLDDVRREARDGRGE